MIPTLTLQNTGVSLAWRFRKRAPTDTVAVVRGVSKRTPPELEKPTTPKGSPVWFATETFLLGDVTTDSGLTRKALVAFAPDAGARSLDLSGEAEHQLEEVFWEDILKLAMGNRVCVVTIDGLVGGDVFEADLIVIE